MPADRSVPRATRPHVEPAADRPASDSGHTAKSTELEREQRFVDRVYGRLTELRAEAAELERHGYRLADVGTQQALYERDVMVYRAAVWARTLDTEHEGLVFGRLDLTGGEHRYVGRLGVRTAQSDPMVIDWRAPAAAAFYQATPHRPQGVVRRRVLVCRGQRVADLEDDLLMPDNVPDGLAVVGDGAFMAALARSRGHTMRDIVATIQAEQDLAIRAPAEGAVIVRGGPGTGKTAVALHRAAYLLYQHRQRFERRGVLVVGPSQRFMAYIERVLPSLGEENATLVSLGGLVEGVEAGEHDAPDLAALKGSLTMAKVLRRAVTDMPPHATAELRITFRGEVLRLDRAALRRVRRRVLRDGRPANVARRTCPRAVLEALWEQYSATGEGRAMGPREFSHQLAARSEFERFLYGWWPRQQPLEVLRSLTDPTLLAEYGAGLLTWSQAERLAASWAGEQLTYQDVALLDELTTLLGQVVAPAPDPAQRFRHGEVSEVTTAADRMERQRPARRDRQEGYGHIIVDEAQDLSPMQWRMLARRGPTASWTIVADPAQSAWADPGQSAAAMDAALGGRSRHEFWLTTNYRNTAEIFGLAARVLPHADPSAPAVRAVRVGGQQPEQVVTGEAGKLAEAVRAAAERLLDQVDGTVGVVVPAGRRAAALDWVTGLPERVQVLSGLESKGLEFDGVVVVEPAELVGEAPNSAAGARTLYVALTRATQRLVTVGADQGWHWLLATPATSSDSDI